jgi:ferredoxin-NADP reductase/Na+-translocating ferredoxin:NAD+ oxidoreductase RnfD subunit
VISSTLLLIVLAAAVASGFGLVGFSPAGILATALAAIVGTLLGSAVGKMVIRTPLHLESSVITGLLITLIVPPTLDPQDLIGATTAGILAGLSKFVIAPGGRHILNPAATGVLIASLFGLTVGFWWVANPPLTLLIVVGGLIVAYRAGALSLVGIFMAIAFSALGARLLLSGEPLGLSLWLMVTSYPVVFLGFFMLTEPLTLPIRRTQQIIVAAVVALLVALPFQVSVGEGPSFSSSPELALVVGNLVAWGLVAGSRHRRATSFTLQEKRVLTDRVSEFSFALDKPLPLLPGQWVEIHLPHRSSDGRGSRRVFSISSDPARALGETPEITVTTRRAEGRGSSFKDEMFALAEGARGRITQVGGEFLPPPGTKPLVMIAGGVGITPFVSWLTGGNPNLGKDRVVWLVQVSRLPGEALYPELQDVAGLTVHRVESLDESERVLESFPAPLAESNIAVSGSPGFVRSTRQTLRRLGGRRIMTDRFTGY